METMVIVPKWVLIVWPKMPQNLSDQAKRFWISMKKRLHWASVVRKFDKAQHILLVYKDKKKFNAFQKTLCTTIHFVCNKKCHYTILKFIRELYVN